MIEPLVTTLLFPVCSCMCGIYPSFSFFWDDIVFCPQQFATQIALIHTSICFPYRKDRIFWSKSTRSAMGGLYAFRFYSFSADVDRVGFDKVQVLTFCVCSPLKLGHSFNHKYFLSPPGLLTLAALLSPAKYRQKHSYQPQIQSTPSHWGWPCPIVDSKSVNWFQSTPPHWGWQHSMPVQFPLLFISIHTLTLRVTSIVRSKVYFTYYFNPHPHTEGDNAYGVVVTHVNAFQSTPSHWGWPENCHFIGKLPAISIHTLTLRVTLNISREFPIGKISIHTLTLRVTKATFF